jgi:predicted naringenin-chalcone synthase
MTHAHLNAVATALPPNEVHGLFGEFARRQIADRRRVILERMMSRSGIERRWSVLTPGRGEEALDAEGFYAYGEFPTTGARMRVYVPRALDLAERAVRGLDRDLSGVTHLIVTSCTGFSAPGLDLQLVRALNLDPGVERTMVGFMGCYAAINALRLARAAVLADPEARVLCVSVELCTLHLQETDDLEKVLSFSIFGDGAAAALVTAEEEGFRLERFKTATMPDDRALITWDVGDQGFDMVLSGEVPAALKRGLPEAARAITGQEEVELWAVHPGGRSILDAVEAALELPKEALGPSREVLHDCGNMSSPTVLFVLDRMMRDAPPVGTPGLALAFGPGLTAEAMRFTAV